MKPSLATLFLLVTSAGLGFFLGWLSPIEQDAGSASHAIQTAQVVTSTQGSGKVTQKNPAAEQDRLLATCASESALEEIPRLLEKLGPFADFQTLNALFLRWAAEEPDKAVAFFMRFDAPDHTGRSIGSDLLAVWRERDPAAAATFAEAQIDTKDSKFGLNALWQTLAKHEPEKAFEKARQYLAPLDIVFAAWAEKDPAAARAALERIPPGKRLEDSAVEVLKRGLEQDPTQTLAWFRTLPDSIRAAVGIARLVDDLDDFPHAVKFQLLGEQLLSFGHHDAITKALRETRKTSLTEEQHTTALAQLFNSVGRSVRTDFADWLEDDASGAIRWATQFPDPNLSQAMLGQLGAGLIESGKVMEGLPHISALPLTTQVEVITNASKSWDEAGRGAAKEVAQKLPDGPLRIALMQAASAP